MNAIRRAGLAGALGAGMALLGVSVAGMASIDGDLRAAAERQEQRERQERATQLFHQRQVSFERLRSGECRRPHDAERWREKLRKAKTLPPT